MLRNGWVEDTIYIFGINRFVGVEQCFEPRKRNGCITTVFYGKPRGCCRSIVRSGGGESQITVWFVNECYFKSCITHVHERVKVVTAVRGNFSTCASCDELVERPVHACDITAVNNAVFIPMRVARDH